MRDGHLHIKPTLTVNKLGYKAIESNRIRLDDCTDSNTTNCDRQAGGDVILNPVRSARLTTKDSFSFKYGRAEVIAKLPQGDWLWPGTHKFIAPSDFDAIIFNIFVQFQLFGFCLQNARYYFQIL